VYSKFAHDSGEVYHPTRDPGTGRLWKRRKAREPAKHGWAEPTLHVIIIEREHGYDSEDWLPGTEPRRRGE